MEFTIFSQKDKSFNFDIIFSLWSLMQLWSHLKQH